MKKLLARKSLLFVGALLVGLAFMSSNSFAKNQNQGLVYNISDYGGLVNILHTINTDPRMQGKDVTLNITKNIFGNGGTIVVKNTLFAKSLTIKSDSKTNEQPILINTNFVFRDLPKTIPITFSNLNFSVAGTVITDTNTGSLTVNYCNFYGSNQVVGQGILSEGILVATTLTVDHCMFKNIVPDMDGVISLDNVAGKVIIKNETSFDSCGIGKGYRGDLFIRTSKNNTKPSINIDDCSFNGKKVVTRSAIAIYFCDPSEAPLTAKLLLSDVIIKGCNINDYNSQGGAIRFSNGFSPSSTITGNPKIIGCTFKNNSYCDYKASILWNLGRSTPGPYITEQDLLNNGNLFLNLGNEKPYVHIPSQGKSI